MVAEHYRKMGDLKSLRKLFATDDAGVKESVLNALWEEPGSNPQMGPGIVQLAIEAAHHPSPGVRSQACFVFQNQCAWKVDVSGAIEPLRSLLNDRNHSVRQMAACAVGNLAKGRYDLSRHVARLRTNLADEDVSVRNYAAWALWQLSRYKHDIGSAVPELVQLLMDDDEWDGPRKNAACALLHHAGKSAENTDQLKECLKRVKLDTKHKEINRFLKQVASLKTGRRSTFPRATQVAERGTGVKVVQTDDGQFCLTVMDADDRTAALFDKLELQGGGYTWEGIVTALVEMKLPEALPLLDIGAEADNMYAYCDDRGVLEQVADLVRAACSDHKLLKAAIKHVGGDLE